MILVFVDFDVNSFNQQIQTSIRFNINHLIRLYFYFLIQSQMTINTDIFNETDVIKSLRSKQSDELVTDDNNVNELLADEPSTPSKSNRGRKRKYQTDEERIIARRLQQKAYRERKKQELAELRALKAKLDAESKSNE